MQKTILPIFLLFFIFIGCEQVTVVQTEWGEESIPVSCQSWFDGCNVYCRTDKKRPSKYAKIPLREKCATANVRRSNCIDNVPKKLKSLGINVCS